MAFSKSHLIGLVAAVAILLAAGRMIRTCKPVESDIDVENIGGPGGIAAKYIHEFLGPGKRVALIFFDESAASIYGKDQYVLEEQLKRYKYRILGKKEISAGPLFSNPQAAYTGTLRMAEYLQFASEHAGADAIISFVGPPVIPEEEEVPEAAGPPLLIASPIAHQATWELLESGLVAMAILPRQEDKDEDELPETGYADPYEAQYEMVTSETAGNM